MPAKLPPCDALKAGYSFKNDRWEGEETKPTATAAASYWKSRGWKADVFTGSNKVWEKGKHVETPYYRVYFYHPKDRLLYGWWAPTDSEWAAEPNAAEMTWFEFV